ncbi:MAG: DNA repair protein RecN [Pseudomonadales bacterium]
MLSHITIHNYAIAQHVDMELAEGMTAITGETGAGKSITLDALGLALGDRANPAAVGPDGNKAEINAGFDIGNNSAALNWLKQRELEQEQDCLLRRVISKDGKSRAFINGRPCTLQDLRELGSRLIDIHGQHQHQSLQNRATQQHILDAFSGSLPLAEDVDVAYQQWQQTKKLLSGLLDSSADDSARAEFLKFQIEELELLGLMEGELGTLEQEQRVLANAEGILSASQQALLLCEDEKGIASQLARAKQILSALPERSEALNEALAMLDSALIQADEAASAIHQHLDNFDCDPARLEQVEARLSAVYDIARKHRIDATDVDALLAKLQQELDLLDCSDERIHALELQATQQLEALTSQSQQLSAKRKKGATRLQKEVTQQLKSLRMENCNVIFGLSPLEQPGACGLEQIDLLVSTNPGQPPQALSKVASGGELSRIGLAIQVVIARHNAIPTLIFDEVDSGIGGAVAEVVGRLLRELGQENQILCVTHLAQVASQAHHHFVVSKGTGKRTSNTELKLLDANQRVEEIARMLGGLDITENTRAHASEMLSRSA